MLFTEDPELSRERLQRALRELGYNELALPRKIVSIGELPLLGTGKVDHASLGQWARAA